VLIMMSKIQCIGSYVLYINDSVLPLPVTVHIYRNKHLQCFEFSVWYVLHEKANIQTQVLNKCFTTVIIFIV